MNSRQASHVFLQAENHFAEKRFQEALDLLERIAAAVPQHEAVDFARAQALVMLGHGAQAMALCDGMVPLFGADGVKELKKALVHLPNSDDDDLQLGFLRPTDEPVSFAMLDSEVDDDLTAVWTHFDLSDPEPEDSEASSLPSLLPGPDWDTEPSPEASVADSAPSWGAIPLPDESNRAPKALEAFEHVVDEPAAPPRHEPNASETLPEAAFENAVEPAAPTRQEPNASEKPPESFDSDLGDFGPLSPLDDETPPAETSPAETPPAPSFSLEGLGDLEDLGALRELDDREAAPAPAEAPDPSFAAQSPAAFFEFDNDLGALGDFQAAEQPVSERAPDFTLSTPGAGGFDHGNDLGALPDWELPEPEPPEDTPVVSDADADDFDSNARLSGFETPAEQFEPAPPEPITQYQTPTSPPPPFNGGNAATELAPMVVSSPLDIGIGDDGAAAGGLYNAPLVFEPTPPPPAPVQAPPAAKRSYKGVAAILVLVAVAGGAGAYLYMSGYVQAPGDPAVTTEAPVVSIPSAAPAPVAPPPAQREPEFTEATFAAMVERLGSPDDLPPLVAQLQKVEPNQWPSRDEPALRVVVDAARRNEGALSPGQLELARYLLHAGANPNHVDSNGRSAMDDAAQTGDEALVHLLLDRGATATPALMDWLARTGRLPLVEKVLRQQPDAATSDALYAAIDGRQDAVVEALINQGARLEDAMQTAVRNGTRHVVRFAVERKVDLARHSNLLFVAIDAQQPAMLELLLREGADVNVRNQQGATPFQVIQAKAQPTHAESEMKRVLAEYQTVKPAAKTNAAPAAASTASDDARELGVLFARSRQREEPWAEVGMLRGSITAASDKVYRLAIQVRSTDDLNGLANLRPADLFGLRLEGPGVTDQSLASVGHLSGLRELEIIGGHVSDTGFQHLKKLSLLVSLRLSAPANAPRAQINGPGLAHLRPMLNLAHLDLSGTALGDRAMPVLDSLTSLRSLDLSGTDITDAGLANIRNLRNLEVLVLGADTGNIARVNGSALYGIRDLTNLRALHLYGIPMSPTGFDVLEQFRNLTFLDLRNTRLTDADLPRLKALTHVSTLWLAENELSRDARTVLQQALPTATLKF